MKSKKMDGSKDRKWEKGQRNNKGVGDLFYFDAAAWGVLAHAKRPFVKGSKHRLESIEKARATVRAKVRRLFQERMAPAVEARRRRNLAIVAPAVSNSEKILQAMEPGGWYGLRDVINLAAIRSVSAKPVLHQKMPLMGLVERARNPAWGGPAAEIEHFRGGDIEPKWLFRLTPAGEARRALLLKGVRVRRDPPK